MSIQPGATNQSILPKIESKHSNLDEVRQSHSRMKVQSRFSEKREDPQGQPVYLNPLEIKSKRRAKAPNAGSMNIRESLMRNDKVKILAVSPKQEKPREMEKIRFSYQDKDKAPSKPIEMAEFQADKLAMTETKKEAGMTSPLPDEGDSSPSSPFKKANLVHEPVGPSQPANSNQVGGRTLNQRMAKTYARPQTRGESVNQGPVGQQKRFQFGATNAINGRDFRTNRNVYTSQNANRRPKNTSGPSASNQMQKAESKRQLVVKNLII